MNPRAATTIVSAFLRAFSRRLGYNSPASALSPSQTRILDALLHGATLKSHRYLDGNKDYRLHPLEGDAILVPWQDVRQLEEKGLLLSNQKFPAATLILSKQGRRMAAKVIGKTVPTDSPAYPASSSP